jgi:GTP-binding protein LepA
MSEQFLDSMDLEKERGITIKQHSVRLEYKAQDGQDYILNLIDTPGHVDFATSVPQPGRLPGRPARGGREPGRGGTDAGQRAPRRGRRARDHPRLEQDRSAGAEPEKAQEQIENVIGIDASDAIRASAKQGIGIDEILEAIVHRIRRRRANPDGPLRRWCSTPGSTSTAAWSSWSTSWTEAGAEDEVG